MLPLSTLFSGCVILLTEKSELLEGKRHYTNCAAYGEWSEVAKELKAGDLVHVFGYNKERRNNDKLYKNFIVKHMNKIEKENKEEK